MNSNYDKAKNCLQVAYELYLDAKRIRHSDERHRMMRTVRLLATQAIYYLSRSQVINRLAHELLIKPDVKATVPLYVKSCDFNLSKRHRYLGNNIKSFDYRSGREKAKAIAKRRQHAKEQDRTNGSYERNQQSW